MTEETATDEFDDVSGLGRGCPSRSEALIRRSGSEEEPEVPSIQRKEAKSRRSSSSLDNYLQRQLINVVFTGGLSLKILLSKARSAHFYAAKMRRRRVRLPARARAADAIPEQGMFLPGDV